MLIDFLLAPFVLADFALLQGTNELAEDSTVNQSNAIGLSYDLVSRLTGFNAPTVTEAFSYDAVGNRTNTTINLGSYTTTFASTSNRISQTTGPTPESFSFDANGSIVADTIRQFSYDARGRMKAATTTAGTTQYVVNSLGQRVMKISGGAGTVFQYDSGGMLIGESDTLGNVSTEYVYVNGIPLAVLK